MSQYNIAVIVGSLRRNSYNKQLATALSRLAPAGFSLTNIDIADLPLYNQDDDDDPAPEVKRLKSEIQQADGLLFITPEYNRSMPGVLKNVLDHGSRPYGQSVWGGKPAGIIGVSPGALGTALAQQHLRSVLTALNVTTMAKPEAYLQYQDGLFDNQGDVGGASRQFLQKWIDDYTDWVKKHCAA